MKIIQISVVADKDSGFPQIFGLAEDNGVHRYSWKEGEWKQFQNKPETKKAK